MKKENNINHYIDLHAHLDGCITVGIAKKLAALQKITLPSAADEELLSILSVPDTCEDLNDFLKCFDLPLLCCRQKNHWRKQCILSFLKWKEMA